MYSYLPVIIGNMWSISSTVFGRDFSIGRRESLAGRACKGGGDTFGRDGDRTRPANTRRSGDELGDLKI